ncbi:MAG: hypothetical protein WAM14_13010 [Candidatus Nitrosopolaris sp.]
MEYTIYTLDQFCSLIKGSYSSTKTTPGRFPLVVTGPTRYSADTYQIDGKAVCIPLVSSTGHGNASIKRIHYQEGKFALASILLALLPDAAICDPKYLFHLLSYKKQEYFVTHAWFSKRITKPISSGKGKNSITSYFRTKKSGHHPR